MNHPLTKGTRVKLVGLQNAPQLNGKIGTVQNPLSTMPGRYAVELSDGDAPTQKTISVKRENLHAVVGEQQSQQPSSQLEITCLGCREPFAAASLVRCAKCRMVDYCSKECQVKHWKSHHRDECDILRAGRKAKEDDDKLPTDHGARAFVRQRRGHEYYEKGDWVASENEFRTLIEEDDFACAASYLSLGHALCKQDKLDQALAAYQKALTCDSSWHEDGELNARADAYRQIGLMHVNNNNLEEAAKAYRKSLELDPSDSYTWTKYAHALKRQGNLEGAMQALQRSKVANSTPVMSGGVEHCKFTTS